MILVPALVLFTVVMIVPVGMNFAYAFTDWDGFAATADFVGLANFSRLLGDEAVLASLRNTLVFTCVNAPIQIVLGLLLALGLRGGGRVVSILRVAIVFPIAISGVVIGLIGDIVFSPTFGLLSAVGQVPGLEFLAQNWLGDPALAMGTVIAMNLWQWTGLTMLIFVAGLAAIPAELYEAARLDGAGPWAQFRHVTWPLLAPAATINIVLTIIGGLKVFDVILVLTNGGPGTATRSVVMQVAQQGTSNFGYSAATSLVLTLLIIVVTVVLLMLLRLRENRS
jgi:raffinose/stachyose/melibiose transport system permease protein